MSLMDYNSFGLIPVTADGAVAEIIGSSPNETVSIVDKNNMSFIRTQAKPGDKFVIVFANGNSDPGSGTNPYPAFIITNNNGIVKFYAQGNRVSNYVLEVTTEMLGGNEGYIYFNWMNDVLRQDLKLTVYRVTGNSSLLHQAVQNELIMLIQKQLKEMTE